MSKDNIVYIIFCWNYLFNKFNFKFVQYCKFLNELIEKRIQNKTYIIILFSLIIIIFHHIKKLINDSGNKKKPDFTMCVCVPDNSFSIT